MNSILSHKCIKLKLIVLFLVFLTGIGDPAMFSQSAGDDLFNEAVYYYELQEYEGARQRLEKAIETVKEDQCQLRAKIYFLLGASYEKLKDKTGAREMFLKLKEMFEKELIDGFPTIGNINPYSLKTYKKIFKKYFKQKEKERMRPKVNVIEKVGGKKKRGSLAVLIAAGAALVLTVGLLLLTKKKKDLPEVEPLVWKPVEWMIVPAGEFLMGDNTGEGYENSRPAHTVYLDEYHISRYEITFDQYNVFREETGRSLSYDTRWGSGDFPVQYVTWEDANAFCRWLSQKTGENVKLPTEAQWEKAARGTDQRIYPWGNERPLCDYDVFQECSGYGPQPVGNHPAGRSPYGVENMAGNVREWCRDWYDANYYSVSPTANPQGPGSGTEKVVRGGDYYSGMNFNGGLLVRVYYRLSSEPLPQFISSYGFRVVKEQ